MIGVSLLSSQAASWHVYPDPSQSEIWQGGSVAYHMFDVGDVGIKMKDQIL